MTTTTRNLAVRTLVRAQKTLSIALRAPIKNQHTSSVQVRIVIIRPPNIVLYVRAGTAMMHVA